MKFVVRSSKLTNYGKMSVG